MVRVVWSFFRRLPSLILFVMMLNPALGNQLPKKPNLTDQNGYRQGEWSIYFDLKWRETSNELLAAYYRLITYEDDIPTGLVSDFYRSGALQWTGHLLKDRPEVYHGLQTWFYESGQKKSEAMFHNGEVVGSPSSFLRDGNPAIGNWQALYYDHAYEAYENGNYYDAIKLFTTALPHVEAIMERESEEYADIILWLSILYHKIGKREKVLEMDYALCGIYKTMYERGDSKVLSAIFDVARGYKQTNQWEQAELWYRDYFIEQHFASGIHESYGLALTGLGETLLERHQYQEALVKLNEAATFYQKNPPEEKQELELLNQVLRRANFLAGEWDTGVKTLAREVKDAAANFGKQSLQYAGALSALGNFYRMNGQLHEAKDAFISAIPILQSYNGDETYQLLSATIPLIEVYCQLGDAPKADDYIALTQSFFRELDQKSDAFKQMYLGFLVRLSQYYSIMGNNEKLGKLVEELMDFSEKNFGPSSAEFLNASSTKVDLLIRNRKWLDAEVISEKAVGSAELLAAKTLSAQEIRAVAKAFQQYATVLYLNANSESSYQTSSRYFNKSLRTYDMMFDQSFIPEKVDVILGLAMVDEATGNLEQADKLYEQCLSIVEQHFSRDHFYYSNMLFAIAKKAEVRNDVEVSARYYRMAINGVNNYVRNIFPQLSIRERELFFASNEEWIDNFKSFAFSNAPTVPALADDLLDLLLTTKGIVLKSVNQVRSKVLEKSGKEGEALYNLWISQRSLLAKHLQSVPVSIQEIDRLNGEIRSIEKQLAMMCGEEILTTFNWRTIKNKLQDGQAAIEITVIPREIKGDTVYAALVVTNKSEHPRIIPIGDAKTLARQMKMYKNSIRLKLEDTLSYNVFWRPIAEKLTNVERVFLSNDGLFHQLSIGSLFNPKTGTYLVDQIKMHHVLSTAQLSEASDSSPIPKQITIFAHPDYGTGEKGSTVAVERNSSSFFDMESIEDLPGTSEEGVVISKILKGEGYVVEVISEKEATEERLKSVVSPGVLHIATHGFFLPDVKMPETNTLFSIGNDVSPGSALFRSGLLLANCKNNRSVGDTFAEDGVFTGFEASTLNLKQTQLVVLSACETGLGDIVNGEGVYGLQRALTMAGARQIIMSLWKVDDEATQQFMSAFYSAWAESRNTYSAFYTAQKKIKAQFNDPYFWAAFILSENK